ncbi:MAG: glycosyltransferase family 4 protein [Anaerolineales bacterium]|nr:glycosyltransferase family 4 protein [Anaerolineales bacterium]
MNKTTASAQKVPTVALITNDVIGERMAGPGIRYWEFGRVLGQHFPVKLIVPPMVSLPAIPATKDVPFHIYTPHNLTEFRTLVEDCDLMVALGILLYFYPFLAELNKPLVLDIYNPYLLEAIHRAAVYDLSKQLTSNETYLAAIKNQLAAGDFFICAGEKQRDYWLGALSAVGRINPYTYAQDSTLRRLIDVVPFGLPAQPPEQTKAVLKGIYKTITPTDKVILWGGGIWNWFDVLTLIRAMPVMLQQRSDIKLFFMGINQPDQDLPQMEAVQQAIALSKELGLYDRHIFFNDWVAYNDRQNYLLEADIGVSLHFDHVETRFAFRTRHLDNLWAGLPVVSTQGDVMSEMLAAQGLAYLVAPGDVAGVAQTILTLLDRPDLKAELKAQFQQVAAQYHWDVAVRPLLEFCAAPTIAPDKAYLAQWGRTTEKQNLSVFQKGWRALRMGGLPSLARQTGEYLRWKSKKFRKL